MLFFEKPHSGLTFTKKPKPFLECLLRSPIGLDSCLPHDFLIIALMLEGIAMFVSVSFTEDQNDFSNQCF